MRKHILIISAVFPPEQVTSAFLNYDLACELAKEQLNIFGENSRTFAERHLTRAVNLRMVTNAIKEIINNKNR